MAKTVGLAARLARTGMGAGATLGLSLTHCAPACADPSDLPPLWAVSEIKIGALEHDTPGLWSGFSLERAAIGASLNFNGDTSKAYADLRWEIEAPWGAFFAIGLGTAVHDGHLSADSPDHKALGAPVLFHPSAELGYRFENGLSVSFFADHMSNGFSRRYNEGMDSVGVRLGHRLGPLLARETDDGSTADFSGPYIGAVAGYQLGNADWLAFSAGARSNGFAWGGFAGYLWQSGRGVFGLEVDASPPKTSLLSGCIGPLILCRMDVEGVYSVRSRFGWVFGQVLLYGTAGLAIVPWDASAVSSITAKELGGVSSTNYGVAAGVG